MKKLGVLGLLLLGILFFVWFFFGPVRTSERPVVQRNYSNQGFGFAVNLPAGFIVDDSYLNQNLGPGREIPGVAFRIPSSLSAGTNLSSDSHVAIEELSYVDCTPSNFLDVKTSGEPIVSGDNLFMYAETNGAGAGNLYEEAVYVIEKESRCYAVHYFIHSGNIANYEPGAVKEFDRKNLLSFFDSITASLFIY